MYGLDVSAYQAQITLAINLCSSNDTSQK